MAQPTRGGLSGRGDRAGWQHELSSRLKSRQARQNCGRRQHRGTSVEQPGAGIGGRVGEKDGRDGSWGRRCNSDVRHQDNSSARSWRELGRSARVRRSLVRLVRLVDDDARSSTETQSERGSNDAASRSWLGDELVVVAQLLSGVSKVSS